MLMSVINWVNRGDASDRFADVFGANANAARAVADAAIDQWERTIVDFNYPDGGNTFELTLSMSASENGMGAEAIYSNLNSNNQPDAGLGFDLPRQRHRRRRLR